MAEEKRLEPAWTDTGQTHQTDKSKKDIRKTSSDPFQTDSAETLRNTSVQTDISRILLTDFGRKETEEPA